MNYSIIRFNKKNVITGLHKAWVNSLSSLDEYYEKYCSLKEVDLTSICNLDSVKKGDTVEGIWDFVTQLEIDKRMIKLMVMQLRNEVVDSDLSFRELLDSGLVSRDYLLDELRRDNLTFDTWMEKYTDLGKSEMARLETIKIQEAEESALRKTDIEAFDEHYSGACFSLPGIAGKMGADVYYTVQVPFSQLAQLFKVEDDSLPLEFRAQRPVNKKRVEDLTQYILDRHLDYTLPALTASISEQMKFVPAEGFSNVGAVQIPMGATSLVNDGQHRLVSCIKALAAMPSLKYQSLSIVLFYDQGLQRSQQIFADVNNNTKIPSKALSVLFDRHNMLNLLIVEALEFTGLKNSVDFENTSVKAKSSKIWSVVAIKKAVEMVTGLNQKKADALSDDEFEHFKKVIISFLNALVAHGGGDLAGIVSSNSMLALLDARQNKINTHVAYLHSVAITAKQLLVSGFKPDTFDALAGLKELGVNKTDAVWRERLVGKCGKMNPSITGVKLGAAVMLKHLDIDAPADIAQLESLMFEPSTSLTV